VLRRADGTTREMRPRHVVMATGVSGIANIPDIPTLEDFRGTVLHSSQYRDGEDFGGKKALVIGTGNSGHDIAQDLWSSGAEVTLIQRGPSMVVNIEPSAQLAYALYDEGPPLEDCDLIATSMPFALARKSHIMPHRAGADARQAAARCARARRVPARLRRGRLGLAVQVPRARRRLLLQRRLLRPDRGAQDRPRAVRRHRTLRHCGRTDAQRRAHPGRPGGAFDRLQDAGSLVRKLFGDASRSASGRSGASTTGHELRNTYVRTAQPGLWFIGGSFAQCRIYSKYLGLQIKAQEAGLI
jgi:hypothetical protein